MDTISFPDVTQLAVPIFIAAILGEFLWIALKGRGGRYETRDAVTSLIMGAGSVASGILLGFIAWGFFMVLWEITPLDLGTSIGVIILCFVLDDLRYYWVHRFGHRIRWVWASHVNHHSSQHYNLTTALRQPWISPFTLKFLWLGSAMVFLGFHPAMVAFVGAMNLIYQFWIHTEAIKKCPAWFEAVMNTPSHHRVHHATNPIYLDRNYAGIFIIWDKMFGTYQVERDDEPCRYGIVKNLGTFNPIKICLHEWMGIVKDMAGAKSLKDAAMYLLAPPGWSPDGSRETSKRIKAKWQARQETAENAEVEAAE